MSIQDGHELINVKEVYEGEWDKLGMLTAGIARKNLEKQMKKIQDHYFHKAKREGYPARSVYKLQEAQNKYGFLKKGQRILDLGAAPGSWTKYASRVVGPQGKVVALDLHRLRVNGPNIEFIKTDIFSILPEEFLEKFGMFNVVLSDMAPKTSGRKDLDHFRSLELAGRAFRNATMTLDQGGVFFC